MMGILISSSNNAVLYWALLLEEGKRGAWLARHSTIKDTRRWDRLIAWSEHGHRAVCGGDLIVEVEAVVKVVSESG